MFSMEIPTPQHWTALAHVDPSKTSSAPVPGVVATYHPEVAAPLPIWPAMAIPPPITVAITEPASASRQALLRQP